MVRINRDDVPDGQQQRQAPRPTFLDAGVPDVVNIALAVCGTAAVFYDAALLGAGLIATGAFGLGRRSGRGDVSDLRGTAIWFRNELVRVTRERDALYTEAVAARVGRRAADDQRGPQPAAAPAARPSAAVRGGGRPGAVAPAAPLRALDAPLPGEDGRATGAGAE